NRFTLCVDANKNGVMDPGECASPTVRDVFVEVDFMQYHDPRKADLTLSDAMLDVVNAFNNAPAFDAASGKGDAGGCNPGIQLHIQVDEQIPHVANTALLPCTGQQQAGDANFDSIKNPILPTAAGGFGTLAERTDANATKILNAKRLAYHYGLIV